MRFKPVSRADKLRARLLGHRPGRGGAWDDPHKKFRWERASEAARRQDMGKKGIRPARKPKETT